MLRYLSVLFCYIIFVAAYKVVNPGPKYPPTKGEIWPKPQYEVKESTYYTFNPSHFKVETTNETCKLLTNAIRRYSYIVKNKHGCRHYDRRIARRKHDVDNNYRGALELLKVELTTPCENYPYLGMDESYNLSVSTNASLTSKSVWGIMRGLESFSQLFYLSDDRNEVFINTTQIYDAPRYAHRGLLLDTSRHYISVANILRTIDAMEINKMNVFHWHIVDDQSFPYQSERFPEISDQGAYDPSMIYTKDDIKMIIEYARSRSVRVIPEFDVPGHTRSWGNAYPNILTECYVNNRVVGLGPMDPTNNFTYKLLRELFQEVQNWFPEEYFHIGGDEVLLECWQSNPKLQQYMRDHKLSVTELHALFMRQAIPLLANSSKVIVWQEVFDEGVPLNKDTLIQVWKSFWVDEMVKVLTNGHKVLFSSSWYLDYLNSKWEDMYVADPRQMVIDNTSNETLADGIVGGEACMWGEMVDDRNIINRVWPRASAVAEVLWSPGTSRSPRFYRLIPEDTYHRLEEHWCRMLHRGVDAQPPSGPGYCVP